jgi:nucleotide-binding universal stress UspA family protein
MKFKKILCPIELDEAGKKPVSQALKIARQLNAEIHFLYINDRQAGYRSPFEHEDQVALTVKNIAPADLLEQLSITYTVSRGELADEVRKYAESNGMDLIITGHHHHGKWFSSLFDSGDVNIIDSVNIPVLVIPKGND